MKKIVVVSLALVLLAALAPIGRTDDTKLSLVRVRVTSPEQAAYLMTRFDESHNHSADAIELVLWPGDRARLDALGYSYDVVIEDLVAYERAQAARPHPRVRLPGPDRTEYRRLSDYNAEMAALADENPSLVKMFEMKRPSLEGRPIFGIEVASDVDDDDGRPIFYIDGVHHAREWPASEYTLIFAHWLVERYGRDKQVTSLLDRARVIVVPIVNVDGFDYSRESVLSLNQTMRDRTSLTAVGNGFEGYWRKNRRSLSGMTVPVAQRNPDSYGVDPNRNYSYLWGDQQGGSSGSMLDQTYRGSAPFSEPETKNVRDIALGRPLSGVVTNHTYQGSVLRAGGGDAPDDPTLEAIGARMASVMGYENRPSVGYPTTGTTDDWTYAATSTLGFTIEHGVINFHPAYADEVGAHWKQVMKGFMVAAEMAANPRHHSVLEGVVVTNGKPATLELTKRFLTPLSPRNPLGEDAVRERLRFTLTTGPDGAFEWHVPPSSRPYEKKSESYALTISAGGNKTIFTVSVDRGEVVDLGRIRL